LEIPSSKIHELLFLLFSSGLFYSIPQLPWSLCIHVLLSPHHSTIKPHNILPLHSYTL
jgi:hypothetical protein